MPSSAPLAYAESGWERSIEAPGVDAALREELFARWPELRGLPHEVLGGGLRTLNVRFGDAGSADARVVRIALAPEHDLRREAALLRLVAEGVRVPRVHDADARALLLEHVPHEELPATALAAGRVGRAAARIHAHAFGASGFLDAELRIPDPFPTAYDGLRAWAREALAGRAGRRLADLSGAVLALWDRAEATLRSACAAPALVHADFKPANVKWLPAESDVLVLDWEFAWSGPPLMDLGQFLRWGAPGPFVAALARGYRDAGGHLPDGWRRTGELLDLFNLVGLLDHEGEKPVREGNVLRRIRETLSRT